MIILDDFTAYSITERGEVINTRTDRMLKNTLNSNGYLYVTLSMDGRKKKLYIHRLLAKSYLPNPDDLKEVNHKDGNKTNNSLSNLEWISYTGNLKHAYATRLRGTNSKISLEVAAEMRRRYVPRCRVNGTRAMSREFGFNQASISSIVNGKSRVSYE